MVRGPAAAAILDDAAVAFGAAPWEAPALHEALLAVGERHGQKLGKAQAPVRVAVTGRRRGSAAVRVARGAGPGAHAGPHAHGPGPPVRVR